MNFPANETSIYWRDFPLRYVSHNQMVTSNIQLIFPLNVAMLVYQRVHTGWISQAGWWVLAGSPQTVVSVCWICFWDHHESMAMTQEPIYWRYLPYIRPIFQAYVREYFYGITMNWTSGFQIFYRRRFFDFSRFLKAKHQKRVRWLSHRFALKLQIIHGVKTFQRLTHSLAVPSCPIPNSFLNDDHPFPH